MTTKLILLAISVAAFSSCSTLYKSGQTPDDVYYSPSRSYGEAERKEEQKDEVKNYNNYNLEDRTLRLGINDRRFRNFDNAYAYNPYNYNYNAYNYGYNSYNHGYNSFNYGYNSYNYGYNQGYYYNPYFGAYPIFNSVFITPSNPKNTTPRIGNLSGYNPIYNNINTNTIKGGVRPARSYNNSNNNNGSAVGNVIRQIFTPATNNNSSYTPNSNNNSSSNNSRSYTPASNDNRSYTPSNNSSSSGSSSSGSSSSGSGGVTRPPRSGGN